jgi:hypothetical protein
MIPPGNKIDLRKRHKRLHIQDPNCELEKNEENKRNRIAKNHSLIFIFDETRRKNFYTIKVLKKLREEDKQFESHTSHVSLSSIPYAAMIVPGQALNLGLSGSNSFNVFLYYYSLSSLLV